MKLSACMIVKDEERMLPDCLGSIRELVDEIIAVDTGSTDGTVEIAERFGAKVYHHLWEGSFSKHRNQSLGYATGDWVMVIDADERLELKSPVETIRCFLEALPEEVGAVMSPVIDLRENGIDQRWSTIRVFRKGRAFYKYDIHNAIESVREDDGAAACGDIQIFHYGYVSSTEYNQKKIARTWEMLQQAWDATKDTRYLYYMAHTAAHRREYGVSAAFAADYIQSHPRDKTFNKSIWYVAVLMNLAVGNPEQAAYFINAGLEEDEKNSGMKNPDLLFYAAIMSWGEKDIYRAVKAANEWWEAYKLAHANPCAFGSQTLYTINDDSLKAIAFILAMASFDRGKEAWTELCGRGWVDERKIKTEASEHFNRLGIWGLMPWGGLNAAL